MNKTSTLAFFLPVLLQVTGSTVASAAMLPTIDSKAAVSRPGPIERGEDSAAAKLLGSEAPALPELRWLDGQPRTLESLSGRIVVIRSFTNECPFCAASMPTLQRLHERYRDRGVTVLGVYHPKPPSPTAPEDVAVFAKSLGVTFPIAVDDDWKLVQKWWKSYGEAPWTSITWILDGKGMIRHVHPGGEYHDTGGGSDHERCRSDYQEVVHLIETLLSADVHRK